MVEDVRYRKNETYIYMSGFRKRLNNNAIFGIKNQFDCHFPVK